VFGYAERLVVVFFATYLDKEKALCCSSYKGSIIEKRTGFTQEEYEKFTKKINAFIEINSNLPKMITNECQEYDFVKLKVKSREKRYITYATRNQDFSIEEACKKMTNEVTLNNLFQSYKDLIICVVSDFSDGEVTASGLSSEQITLDSKSIKAISFHNTATVRNPYWVVEQKYEDLTMLLNGFCDYFASHYFPHKTYMLIQPKTRMQAIMHHSLKRNEGFFFNHKNQKIDIKELRMEPTTDSIEFPENFIEVSALDSLFRKALMSKRS